MFALNRMPDLETARDCFATNSKEKILVPLTLFTACRVSMIVAAIAA